MRNMKDENRKLRSENKNSVIESETLKSCLARLEKKIDDLKEDFKQEVVEVVKRVVIETMKEENEQREREAKQSGHIWSLGIYTGNLGIYTGWKKYQYLHDY